MRSALALADRLLLAGLAFGAGYAAGLLAAPTTGEQTRRRLADRARAAADGAQAVAHDAVEPLAGRARDAARELSARHLPLTEDLDFIDRDAILADLRRGR